MTAATDRKQTENRQKTQVITCRVPINQWHELEYYCSENNHTMSKVMRSGIKNFLDSQTKTTFATSGK